MCYYNLYHFDTDSGVSSNNFRNFTDDFLYFSNSSVIYFNKINEHINGELRLEISLGYLVKLLVLNIQESFPVWASQSIWNTSLCEIAIQSAIIYMILMKKKNVVQMSIASPQYTVPQLMITRIPFVTTILRNLPSRISNTNFPQKPKIIYPKTQYSTFSVYIAVCMFLYTFCMKDVYVMHAIKNDNPCIEIYLPSVNPF